MRAAAYLSIALTLIGAYLMVAATIGIAPIGIGVGLLAIGVLTAITLVAFEQPTNP
jgi:hypothetical protein